MLSYKLSRSLTPYTRKSVPVTPTDPSTSPLSPGPTPNPTNQTQGQARESAQCTSYYVSIRKLTTWRKGPSHSRDEQIHDS